MRELTILLFCIIAIFVYMNYIRKSLHLSLVESSIDNQKYLVRNLKDNKEAANKLAQLNQSLLSLINSIKSTKKDGVDRLVDNFNPRKITENIPGSMYVAYSVNKGEELSICLRDKDTEKFMDQNTISFVAIHELAHIMSEDTGHTKEFWDNMKFLLEESSKIGVYTPIDYAKNPVIYCGMTIDNTPMNL
jgi:hypothetical protein